MLPFQIAKNLLRRLRGFVPQQSDHLCFGQCAVLRQPFDHMALIIKQHIVHLLLRVRILCEMRILR